MAAVAKEVAGQSVVGTRGGRFAAIATRAMRAAFAVSQLPSHAEYCAIARLLDEFPSRVQGWFGGQRAKLRRQQQRLLRASPASDAHVRGRSPGAAATAAAASPGGWKRHRDARDPHRTKVAAPAPPRPYTSPASHARVPAPPAPRAPAATTSSAADARLHYASVHQAMSSLPLGEALTVAADAALRRNMALARELSMRAMGGGAAQPSRANGGASAGAGGGVGSTPGSSGASPVPVRPRKRRRKRESWVAKVKQENRVEPVPFGCADTDEVSGWV